MSRGYFDDDREIDIESDDEGRGGARGAAGHYQDKRAHHNALERKRRDHIKESFTGLRDAIPTLAQGDKSSRAQILKKASEYISFMRKKNNNHQRDIEDLKRQNGHLEAQIRALERAKASGEFNSANDVLESVGLNYDVSSPISDSNSATTSHSASAVDNWNQEGSGSDTSEGNAPTNIVVTSNGATPTTQVVQVRSIQPGQSLLIATPNGAEPTKKKFKT